MASGLTAVWKGSAAQGWTCAVLTVAFWIVPAAAQTYVQYGNTFQREVNRFRWTSSVDAMVRKAQWHATLRNRFVSDAFYRFNDRLQFRDENVLALDAEHRLGPYLGMGISGETSWFGLSEVYSQELYGGLRIRPTPAFLIEPLVGMAVDSRPGVSASRTDAGPAYGGRWRMEERSFGGYRVQLDGTGTWQSINPRRAHRVAMGGRITRQVASTSIRTAVRMSSIRRDTYRAASYLNRSGSAMRAPESVEATTSDTVEVRLHIDAPVARGIRLRGTAEGIVNGRRIRTHHATGQSLFFETDFNRRAVFADLGLIYERRYLTARLAMEAGAAAESRSLANRDSLPVGEAAQKTALLAQADYDEGVFGISTAVRAHLSKLTTSLFVTSRIVRHDTPVVNQDDRDELYHNGELIFELSINQYLQASLTVLGSYYHAVYLQAERSADNYVQRTLRMRPSVAWTPSASTTVRAVTEVRATYTVDDFVLAGRRPSDQSAREIRFETQVEQRMAKDLHVLAEGSFADLHLGRLQWESFSEIPFDTLRTYRAWLHIRSGRKVIADIGWRIFIRSDYDRSATVTYAGDNGTRRTISRPGRRRIDQSGPTAAILWAMDRSQLRIEGWLNVQHIRYRLFGELPGDHRMAITQAADRGSRLVIPNILVSLTWNP